MTDKEVPTAMDQDEQRDTSWVKDVLNLTDEDLIHKFAEDEMLSGRALFYYCLTIGRNLHCHCLRDLELLIKQEEEVLYQNIQRYGVYHEIGCCPHVWKIMEGSEKGTDSIISQKIVLSIYNEDEIRTKRYIFDEYMMKLEKCGDGSRVKLITTHESTQSPANNWTIKVTYYATLSASPILNILTALGRNNVIERLVYDSFIDLGFLKMHIGTYQKSQTLGLMPIHIAIEHQHVQIQKLYLDLLGDGYFYSLESSHIGKMIYLFALKRNDMKIFYLLLKKYKKLRSKVEYQKILSTSMAFSFANGKDAGILKGLAKKGATLDSLPIWVENLTPFTSMMIKEVLEKVVSTADLEVVNLALKSNLLDFDMGYTLERVVFHDRSAFLKIVMKGRPKEISSMVTSDHLVQAVINNSPTVLGLLLEMCMPKKSLKVTKLKPINQNRYVSTHITNQDFRYAARFSSALDSTACSDLLMQRTSRILKIDLFSSAESTRSPLIEIFKFESKYRSRSELLQTIIEKEGIVLSDYGHSPLGEALRVHDHQSIQVLLLAGADPFPVHALSEKYLMDIIHCNVNISDNLKSMLPYKETYQRSIANFLFVLTSVPCFSAADRAYLNIFTRDFEQLSGGSTSSESDTLMRVIDILLNQPSSLQVLCRNVLRNTYRRREIFRLVNSTPLPRQIKRFLLLEGALEEFRATVEPVRLLTNLDCFISKFSDKPS
ncbi:hypothetical protein FSP39_004942 [Pinctada imbricata]|uniref:SOCS box domain-containing protein n=1 Tax=Pinctada imbricata TaxID=66713 RepID=A0AA89BKK9_PINIB|nr:hypothetical protein FSP39_004942 [Pinctada imbricata]